MPDISNRKRRFIEKNCSQFSIEELSQKTGLKSDVIKSLIDEHAARTPGRRQQHSGTAIEEDVLLKTAWIALALFMVACLVYAPALKNGFVWDDYAYITANSMIRSIDAGSLYKMFTVRSVGNWHPLTSLSHAIDYASWELDPFGYHLTNSIFHGLNTVLLFLLVVQLMVRAGKEDCTTALPAARLSTATKSLIAAGITSLLFALHPLQVESVAWVAERKNVLCTFFMLSTFHCYLMYAAAVCRARRYVWFSGSLVLFLFALLSKPMAVTLPVLLLILDWYPLKRMHFPLGGRFSVLLEKIPFFILSLADSIITIMVQRNAGSLISFEQLQLGPRLLNAVRTSIFYLEKTIMPLNLVPYYPLSDSGGWSDARTLLSGMLVVGITVFCIWMAHKKKPLFLAAWVYYTIALLPMIGIIQVGNQAAADRYTYLPTMSIFLLGGIAAVWVVEKISLTNHRKLLGGLFFLGIAVVCFLLAKVTVNQIKIWRDSESLWRYVAGHYPDSVSFAHYNLGIALSEQGRIDEAVSAYNRTLAINPRYEKAYFSLGYAYLKKGLLDEAIPGLKRALTLNPDYADAHYALGSAYDKKGLADEALSHYKRAVTIKPRYAEVHYSLGVLYQNRGAWEEALSAFQKAIANKPRYPEAHQNLSFVYYYTGNPALALRHCEMAEKMGYRVSPKLLELLKPYR